MFKVNNKDTRTMFNTLLKLKNIFNFKEVNSSWVTPITSVTAFVF